MSQQINTKESSESIHSSSDIDFGSFIASLATSALVHLGEGPTEDHLTPSINLPLAKQSIELIGMLREKTRGNLNLEEQRLIDEFLYELRSLYIQASKTKQS